MQWQYKFVIQFVQEYKNLYAKFEAYLRRNEGLIRNSVLLGRPSVLWLHVCNDLHHWLEGKHHQHKLLKVRGTSH